MLTRDSLSESLYHETFRLKMESCDVEFPIFIINRHYGQSKLNCDVIRGLNLDVGWVVEYNSRNINP